MLRLDEVLPLLKRTPLEERPDVLLQHQKASNVCVTSNTYHPPPFFRLIRKSEILSVFATNHIRGVQVFKEAEAEAARIQDTVRFRTLLAVNQS